MKKVLIIEDELGQREALKETFYGLYEVACVENAIEGLTHLSRERSDIVLVDLVMPRVNGIMFLKEARELYPDVPVFVVTASSSDDLIKQAFEMGAVGLVRKPWEVHELRNLVRQALAATEATRKHELLSKEVVRDFPSIAPIGQSAVFRRMLENAKAVSERHVLLIGERGIGKEFVARQIHAWSRRAAEPFVTVSCRELPLAFIESEIFGQWSSATEQSRRGAVDLAHDSTLFLEDIDCLPHEVQNRLIQLVTRGEYQRVGSSQMIHSTSRIVATLEKPCSEMIASNRVLAQLVDAFSPGMITVPPLRERRDDIPLLAHHFLHQFRQSLHAETLDIAPGAMQKLRDYDWPGNVRELRNVIERLLVLYGTSKHIAASELPQELMRPDISDANGMDYAGLVSAYERSLIESAFERSNGTIAAAARLLGITARQLQTRVENLQIRRSPYKN